MLACIAASRISETFPPWAREEAARRLDMLTALAGCTSVDKESDWETLFVLSEDVAPAPLVPVLQSLFMGTCSDHPACSAGGAWRAFTRLSGWAYPESGAADLLVEHVFKWWAGVPYIVEGGDE